MKYGTFIFKNRLSIAIAAFLLGAVTAFSSGTEKRYSYAVVIHDAAYSDAGWKEVTDSLLKRHDRNGTARMFKWSSSVNDVVGELSEFKPDYIGFIARPVSECNSAFIVAVSRLCRTLDDDIYGDAVWGIITGYEASDALRVVGESLTVKTVLAASGHLSKEPPIERFYQAIGMTCDSYTETDYLFPGKNGVVYSENRRPDNEQDRIKIVSKWLNSTNLDITIANEGSITGPVDCIITGGHGNVNLWQCHYPDADGEGYMQSSAGNLFGAPYLGNAVPIDAPAPKIFWCASNCLMGNPDNNNNIVYAAFHTGHAVQMFGFVNNASSGDEFMAWGVYDRVTKCAGRVTLPEGFFFSNNNALFEIEHSTGQMNTGLVRAFMDSTVVYGDPAADVRFYDTGDSAQAYLTALTWTKGTDDDVADFTFTYTMKAHDLEFGAGYCYQFRPVCLLPVRIDPSTVTISQNDGHKAVITDNLLIWEMLSEGEKLEQGTSSVLKWSAVITDDKTGSRGVKPPRAVSHEQRMRVSLSSRGTGTVAHCSNVPAGTFEISVVNAAGRSLFSGRFTSSGSLRQSFPLRGVRIPPGVYYVVVTVKGAAAVRNVIALR